MKFLKIHIIGVVCYLGLFLSFTYAAGKPPIQEERLEQTDRALSYEFEGINSQNYLRYLEAALKMLDMEVLKSNNYQVEVDPASLWNSDEEAIRKPLVWIWEVISKQSQIPLDIYIKYEWERSKIFSEFLDYILLNGIEELKTPATKVEHIFIAGILYKYGLRVRTAQENKIEGQGVLCAVDESINSRTIKHLYLTDHDQFMQSDFFGMKGHVTRSDSSVKISGSGRSESEGLKADFKIQITYPIPQSSYNQVEIRIAHGPIGDSSIRTTGESIFWSKCMITYPHMLEVQKFIPLNENELKIDHSIRLSETRQFILL